MPAFNPRIFAPGAVGVISRSGRLGTLICLEIVRAGLGISAFIGIGGDPILGTTTRDALALLDRDPRTAAVALVGEIGGAMEEDGGRVRRAMTKPVVAFIAGARLAAGQEDGPRRRDRQRRAAAATRPSAGRSRRPASRCWRRRPGSASSRVAARHPAGGPDDGARRSAAHPVEPTTKGWPALAGALPLGAVGRQGWNLLRQDLPLPVAVLKAPALSHNSRWMRGFLEHFDVRLCPHGKTTMAPQLFARQLADGAFGITVATVQQLMVCRRFGVPRVVIANQLIGRQAIRTVIAELEAHPSFEFLCVVDSLAGFAALEQ